MSKRGRPIQKRAAEDEASEDEASSQPTKTKKRARVDAQPVVKEEKTRGRKKPREEEEDEEEEEEEAPRPKGRTPRTSTQPGGRSQAPVLPASQLGDDDYIATQALVGARALATLGAQEQEHLVANVVRYLLFRESRRQISRRADIIKEAIGSQFKDRKISTAVIAKAKDRLRDVFGYNLVELPGRAGGSYILLNRYSPEDLGEALQAEYTKSFTDMEHRERSLLLIVLSLVFIGNGKVPYETILNQLKLFNLEEDSKEVNWVNQAVKNFIAQHYLEKETDEREKDKAVLSLGERAILEIGKKRILQHLSEVFGHEVDSVLMKEIEAEDKEREKNKPAGNAEEDGEDAPAAAPAPATQASQASQASQPSQIAPPTRGRAPRK